MKTLRISYHLILSAIVLLTGINLRAQEKTSLQTVEKIASKILNETNYNLIDKESGELYSNPKNFPVKEKVRIASPYVEWKYWNGVLNQAFLELYNQTQKEEYKNQVLKNYQFIFDNMDYFKTLNEKGYKHPAMDQFFRMRMLDDCGAMGAGLIETYKIDKRDDYKKYIDKAANYILNDEYRFEDGTLARLWPYDKTLWLDDLYMGLSFISRMGTLTNDVKFYDFAAQQVIGFTKYLYDENTGIYFHCYFDNYGDNGVARWGRANGWGLMAQAYVLASLPDDHPQKEILIDIFRQHVNGLARYQDLSGLWHQIIDKPDSYLETSSTAMFTYAIAKGINEGWLDGRYKTIVQNAWKGLESVIDEEGNVSGICIGTGIQNDIAFYYNRPTQKNDIHGLGAVIIAGIEVSKMK